MAFDGVFWEKIQKMQGHCRGAFKLIEPEQSMTPDAMFVISLENFFNAVPINVLQNIPDIHVIFVESLNGATCIKTRQS